MFARTLLAVVAAAPFATGLLQGQGIGLKVTGIVLDASRAPLGDAQVVLQTSDSSLLFRTGPDGRFSFANLHEGEARVSARRLGYSPASVQLTLTERGGLGVVQIVLQAVATQLSDVIVVGHDTRLHEFYERRMRHTSGQFLTGEEIRDLHPRFTSDVFRRVAGASVRGARFGSTIRLRGCRPKLWIDRVPVRDVELDEVVTPAEIAGLEIYASSAGMPAEYMDREPRPCGVILVWTRIE